MLLRGNPTKLLMKQTEKGHCSAQILKYEESEKTAPCLSRLHFRFQRPLTTHDLFEVKNVGFSEHAHIEITGWILLSVVYNCCCWTGQELKGVLLFFYAHRLSKKSSSHTCDTHVRLTGLLFHAWDHLLIVGYIYIWLYMVPGMRLTKTQNQIWSETFAEQQPP